MNLKFSIAFSWQLGCFVAEMLSGRYADYVEFAVGVQQLANAAWREATERNPQEACYYMTGDKTNENLLANQAGIFPKCPNNHCGELHLGGSNQGGKEDTRNDSSSGADRSDSAGNGESEELPRESAN